MAFYAGKLLGDCVGVVEGVSAVVYAVFQEGIGFTLDFTVIGAGAGIVLNTTGIAIALQGVAAVSVWGSNISVDMQKLIYLAEMSGSKGSGEAVNGLEKTSNLITTHRITMEKNKFNKFVEKIKNEVIKEPIKYVEYNGKKYIVDGHHRLQAAKRLGIEDVPVEKVDLPYAGYKSIEDLLWSD